MDTSTACDRTQAEPSKDSVSPLVFAGRSYGMLHTSTGHDSTSAVLRKSELSSMQNAWEDEQRASHVPRLAETLQIPERLLTGRHVNAMWHLCQQEAGLWGVTDKACSLFPAQVSHRWALVLHCLHALA